MTYWPFWAGGVALAVVAVGHAWWLRRPMGVSGLFTTLVNAPDELRVARANRALQADPNAWEAELLAATMRAQASAGAAVQVASASPSCADDGTIASPTSVAAASTAALDCTASADENSSAASAASSPAIVAEGARENRVVAAAVFLVCIAIGGALARVVRGGLSVDLDMGRTFHGFFGHGWAMWAALAIGGALVGAGTRMAGGCTSGHGLSGVARLQPGSLAATAVFFGTGIAVSLLLGKVLVP